MERLKKLITIIEAMGQGAYIESISFNSGYNGYNYTIEEIKELANKYPNWIAIKEDKVYSDPVIIKEVNENKHKELLEDINSIVNNNEFIQSVKGDENYITVYMEDRNYTDYVSMSMKTFLNDYKEIIKDFKQKSDMKNYEFNIRANKDNSIVEIIKEAHQLGYKIGFIYDLCSALEFTKINNKSITIIDGLENKKYLTYDEVNKFDKDGLRIFTE